MAGTTPTTIHPTPDRGPEGRFTFGLMIEVLEAHGYGPFDGCQIVELQQHLFVLLHGDAEVGCTGRSLATVEAGR